MTWESQSCCSNMVGIPGVSWGFPLCISEQSPVVDPQASSGAGKAFLWLHSLVTELFSFSDDNL